MHRTVSADTASITQTRTSGVQTYSARVAAVVHDVMDRRGVGIMALSESAHIRPTTLYRNLCGERPFPVDRIGRVAATLDTTVSELLRSAGRDDQGRGES